MSPLPQVPAVTRTNRVWTAPWTQSKDQLNPAMWHGIGTHAIGLDGAMWRKRPLDCTVPGRAAMKRRWSQAVSGAPSTRTEPGGAGPGSGTLVGAPNVALGPPQNPAMAARPSQTIRMKAGCCYIRTSGTLYTYEPYADLRIDLTQGVTTLRTASRGVDAGDSTDGRDEVLQEQLMSLPCYRNVLQQAEQLIEQEVRQGKTIRMGVESTLGRHRSIAFAEILRQRLDVYTHVDLRHLEEHRWKDGADPRLPPWKKKEGSLVLNVEPGS